MSIQYFKPGDFNPENDSDWIKLDGRRSLFYKIWKRFWENAEVPPLSVLDYKTVPVKDRVHGFPQREDIELFYNEDKVEGFVREEYRRFYRYLEYHAPKEQHRFAKIITGQPGVGGSLFSLCYSPHDISTFQGKTRFRSYMLQRRLREHRPTLLPDREDGSLVLFCKQGCFKALTSECLDDLTHHTWCLLDPADKQSVLSSPSNSYDPMIVLTTSPDENIWKPWGKTELHLEVLVMQPWSTLELQLG